MINQFLEASSPAPVEVGNPATILYVSDRVPCVVTEVINFKSGPNAGTPKQVSVQSVEVTGDPDHIGYAKEIHLDRRSGGTRTFTIRKDGVWRDQGGTALRIGSADYYYDPSF
jgi:hypothetical protein